MSSDDDDTQEKQQNKCGHKRNLLVNNADASSFGGAKRKPGRNGFWELNNRLNDGILSLFLPPNLHLQPGFLLQRITCGSDFPLVANGLPDLDF